MFRLFNFPVTIKRKKPLTITQNGKVYVDGIHFYGGNDAYWIKKCGYDFLNFCPSTPPPYR